MYKPPPPQYNKEGAMFCCAGHSKCGKVAAAVVFMQQNRVGLAFTVERDKAGGALRQEDAEGYALRELEKAGIASAGVKIEAFENQEGWLVFCTVEKEMEAELYIQFEGTDDFLDAINAHGTGGVTLCGWEGAQGYTVRMSGPRGRVAVYAARLSEYGLLFEAPAGYARHLEEQACTAFRLGQGPRD
jgi:hypothetical protein